MAIAESFYWVGLACGSALTAPFSDRYGRWRATYFLLAGSIVASVCETLAPSSGLVELYATALFVHGFCNSNVFVAYTLIMESFPSHRRASVTTKLNVLYSITFGASPLFLIGVSTSIIFELFQFTHCRGVVFKFCFSDIAKESISLKWKS